MPIRGTLSEIEQRIDLVRRNISELTEQATAYSGAADEERVADRIAAQQDELDALLKQRDAMRAGDSAD